MKALLASALMLQNPQFDLQLLSRTLTPAERNYNVTERVSRCSMGDIEISPIHRGVRVEDDNQPQQFAMALQSTEPVRKIGSMGTRTARI